MEFNEIAEKIEAQLAAVAADRKISDEKRDALMADLGAKQAELAKQMAAVEQKLSKPVAAPSKKADSLGARFVASDAYKAFISGSARSARLSLHGDELAAILTPTGAGHVTLPGVVGNAEQVPTVEAVIPSVPVTGNAVEYLKATTETNASAATAEGGKLPESAFAFSMETAPVRTIGAIAFISRQLAEDTAAVATYITSRMAYHLNRKVEEQIVAGDGLGQNLKGIFTAGNFTAHGLEDTTLTGLDVVRKCATLVRAAGFTPSVVFLNPIDYDNLIGEKDKQGRYQFANPTAANEVSIWGLRPVLSSAVTAGKVIVADPSAAMIYDRTQMEVALFEQDSDNVQKNLVTIRAERRLGFAVENTAAFIGGDLKIAG